MELIRINDYTHLAAVPAGTQVWGTTLEKTGWGTPYSAQGKGLFWDWGNDFDVPAEDIALPAFALPEHPYAIPGHPTL